METSECKRIKTNKDPDKRIVVKVEFNIRMDVLNNVIRDLKESNMYCLVDLVNILEAEK